MRASRIALLAAAQFSCALLASGTAHAVDARVAWSDLWRTPDQQGQALLDAGRPTQAAGRFHDPRRRAYAEIEAGRYQDAAKLLAPFDDARSEYNRGNALAEVGQLQAALASYDAALKQAPGDKDVRHNRDLVEQALQQQRSQASPRNGRQSGHGAGSGQRQQSAGGQESGSGSRQSGAGGSQSGAGRTASNGSQAGGGHAGNSGQQQPGGGGIQPGSGGPQATGSGSGASQEAPGQAQRDAAMASAYERQRQQHGAADNQAAGSRRDGTSGHSRDGAANGPDSGLLAGGTQTPKQKPESERQLALDQWLRQIPDSPAGLLQRKFLIEHMMKQQDGDDPQGSGP
jgi:Ca-activated chloride channel homolog